MSKQFQCPPKAMKQILRSQAKSRQKAITNLFWAVQECVHLFGFVEISAGRESDIPYPRVGVKWSNLRSEPAGKETK